MPDAPADTTSPDHLARRNASFVRYARSLDDAAYEAWLLRLGTGARAQEIRVLFQDPDVRARLRATNIDPLTAEDEDEWGAMDEADESAASATPNDAAATSVTPLAPAPTTPPGADGLASIGATLAAFGPAETLPMPAIPSPGAAVTYVDAGDATHTMTVVATSGTTLDLAPAEGADATCSAEWDGAVARHPVARALPVASPTHGAALDPTPPSGLAMPSGPRRAARMEMPSQPTKGMVMPGKAPPTMQRATSATQAPDGPQPPCKAGCKLPHIHRASATR